MPLTEKDLALLRDSLLPLFQALAKKLEDIDGRLRIMKFDVDKLSRR
jgi:hypothetical protein